MIGKNNGEKNHRNVSKRKNYSAFHIFIAFLLNKQKRQGENGTEYSIFVNLDSLRHRKLSDDEINVDCLRHIFFLFMFRTMISRIFLFAFYDVQYKEDEGRKNTAPIAVC